MKKPDAKLVRLQELKEMLASYRLMTVEDVEASGWGDLEIELEGEVWRLEQELNDEGKPHREAA
jgi:uncharacterized protein (UPF0371 family)